MTDELLYTKLARHTAETGSPLPVLHGDHVGFLGVVYPLVLSPFYGAFDAPGASAHFPLRSDETTLHGSEQDRGHTWYVLLFQGFVRRARMLFMVYCNPFRRSQTGTAKPG